MNHLIIAGGTGLVGSRLKSIAIRKGYKVSILTRNKTEIDEEGYFNWNPSSGEMDEKALEKADYLVNLSGANIVEKAWSDKRKNELISSRVDSTHLLVEKFTSARNNIKAVVNASAIGFYESSLTRIMHEDEEHAKGFMGELCFNWEQAARQFQNGNIRTVILRFGIVLSKNGGAYKAMAVPAKLGIGSYIGSGKQKMPWVHIDDLCNLIIYALENEIMSGVFNTTIPDAPSNKSFTKALLKSFNKIHILIPTPKFLIQMILGSRSDLVCLSYNPSAEKLLKTGFTFKYKTLEEAFKSLK